MLRLKKKLPQTSRGLGIWRILSHQLEGRMIRRGLLFLLKMHKLGVVNSGGLKVNRQYGESNISKLLQLVVNIVYV